MKITVLKYAESVFGENYLFKGGISNRLLPITFVFYLIETENKKILVDVGCDECGGFVFSPFKKPVEVLGDYGLTPLDITDVILTHSHHDHISCIGHYKNAVIHIQREEYPSAKEYIPKGFRLNLFDEEYCVAEGVTIKKIGGHSKGSSIVLAENHVFCGDECYVKKCLTDKIPTGASCFPEASLEFLEKYGNGDYITLLFHDPDIKKGKIGAFEI